MKKCSSTLCLPLAIIFSTSYSYSVLPWQWKYGFIVPIYKKGNKSKPENYRPVTLTSPVCRVMESILAFGIRKVFKNSFCKNQYGFLKGKSCMTQLLEVISDWQISLKNRKIIDCVYFDFRKAFDKVVHHKLLYKCKQFGFPDLLINWLKNFLINRTSIVKINEALSTDFIPHSGVPQGTVLGPLLFLIFINDLPNVIPQNIKCALFADDLKLYGEDGPLLQQAIDAVNSWSKDWQMPFAPEKINVLHLGQAGPRHEYFIDRQKIEPVECIRDLGIYVDNKLTFSHHISVKSALAFQRCQHLLSAFPFASTDTYVKLFTTYVRPILDYGSEIFSPRYSSPLCAKIERPLRYFTKIVCSRKNIRYQSYKSRLEHLKIEPLFLRRRKTDILTAFKLLLNVFDFPHLQTHLVLRGSVTSRPCRPHRFVLKKRRLIYKDSNWYFSRIVNLINSLPPELNDCSTIEDVVSVLTTNHINPPRNPPNFYR